MGTLFGTDGIRGQANRYPMDCATALAAGQAVAHLTAGTHPRTGAVVVGRDTRISGPMLESALAAGIVSMGVDCLLAGVLPTPGIAHLARDTGALAGIVISASHNPFEDNGIKIFSGQGFKLSDEEEGELEALMTKGTLPDLVAPAGGIGRIRPLDHAEERYAGFLKRAFPEDLSMEGMRLVMDTANGAASRVAPAVFSGLGALVDVLHDAPDGVNINDACGSQHTEELRERVVRTGAALGLAFDGDADRLIAVDEHGRELSGDQILMICARSAAAAGALLPPVLVGTVMSNLGLRVACERHGIEFHASGVGDRYVLEDMRRLGAVMGGEQSGHMIFLDHHTTGDGILSAVRLMEAMIREDAPLSELASVMDVYPQMLLNVAVRAKPDISTVPRVVEAVSAAESELGDHGRVLVRYSGTQDLCRVMVEGPTTEQTERIARAVARTVQGALG